MKGFSLTQPWATLVAHELKRWETRSWGTRFRGDVVIHASKGFPSDCRELCFEPPFNDALASAGITTLRDLPVGSILCIATLTDCRLITSSNPPDGLEYAFGNYEPGRFMLRLENVHRFSHPIPCKGALGFWEIPSDVLEQIEQQLAGTYVPRPLAPPPQGSLF